MCVRTLSLLLVTAFGICAADDNPLIGSWKLDPSKSNFAGQTLKFEAAENGALRCSAGGQSYTFKTDGQPHPALFGRVVSVREIDPGLWQMTTSYNGRVLSFATMTISSDGNELLESARGVRPSGESFESTTLYTREAGASGMLGTWKTKELKNSAPVAMQFAAAEQGGLAFSLPALKAMSVLKLDGKDYPAVGPTIPEGFTLAIQQTGPRAVTVLQKINGKPVFKSTYVVSDDGKILTTTGTPATVDEPVTAVYIRQ
jgi:hypothetical protein